MSPAAVFANGATPFLRMMEVTERLVREITRLHAATAVIKAFLIQLLGSPELQMWTKLYGSEDLQSKLGSFKKLRETDYYGDTEVIEYFHQITTAVANNLSLSQIHILSHFAHFIGCSNGKPSTKLIRFAADPFDQLHTSLHKVYWSMVSDQERTTFEHFDKLARDALYWVDYHMIKKRDMLFERRTSYFEKSAPQQIKPGHCFGMVRRGHSFVDYRSMSYTTNHQSVRVLQNLQSKLIPSFH